MIEEKMTEKMIEKRLQEKNLQEKRNAVFIVAELNHTNCHDIGWRSFKEISGKREGAAWIMKKNRKTERQG